MANELVIPDSLESEEWSPQERAWIEAAGLTRRARQDDGKYLTVAAPPAVVGAFIHHMTRTQLDPIARQIYCIHRGGKWTTQVGIDGARLVAQRSNEYEGQDPPLFSDDGVTWTEAWLGDGEGVEGPKFAKVSVYRSSHKGRPTTAIARWDSYAVKNRDWDTQEEKLGESWAKMPDVMLAKVAEMLALRKAFPQDLGGLYLAEEMDQAAQGHTELRVEKPQTKDWMALLLEAKSQGEVTAIFTEMRQKGEYRAGSDFERVMKRRMVDLPADLTDEAWAKAEAPEEAWPTPQQARTPARGHRAKKPEPEVAEPVPLEGAEVEPDPEVAGDVVNAEEVADDER